MSGTRFKNGFSSAKLHLYPFVSFSDAKENPPAGVALPQVECFRLCRDLGVWLGSGLQESGRIEDQGKGLQTKHLSVSIGSWGDMLEKVEDEPPEDG